MKRRIDKQLWIKSIIWLIKLILYCSQLWRIITIFCRISFNKQSEVESYWLDIIGLMGVSLDICQWDVVVVWMIAVDGTKISCVELQEIRIELRIERIRF